LKKSSEKNIKKKTLNAVATNAHKKQKAAIFGWLISFFDAK
jgi:hypothetical protein